MPRHNTDRVLAASLTTAARRKLRTAGFRQGLTAIGLRLNWNCARSARYRDSSTYLASPSALDPPTDQKATRRATTPGNRAWNLYSESPAAPSSCGARTCPKEANCSWRRPSENLFLQWLDFDVIRPVRTVSERGGACQKRFRVLKLDAAGSAMSYAPNRVVKSLQSCA